MTWLRPDTLVLRTSLVVIRDVEFHRNDPNLPLSVAFQLLAVAIGLSRIGKPSSFGRICINATLVFARRRSAFRLAQNAIGDGLTRVGILFSLLNICNLITPEPQTEEPDEKSDSR